MQREDAASPAAAPAPDHAPVVALNHAQPNPEVQHQAAATPALDPGPQGVALNPAQPNPGVGEGGKNESWHKHLHNIWKM